MVDLRGLFGKAKETAEQAAEKAKTAFDEAGGVDRIKADASSVADAVKGPGSLKDKAVAAKDALAHSEAPVEDTAPAESGTVAEAAAVGQSTAEEVAETPPFVDDAPTPVTEEAADTPPGTSI